MAFIIFSRLKNKWKNIFISGKKNTDEDSLSRGCLCRSILRDPGRNSMKTNWKKRKKGYVCPETNNVWSWLRVMYVIHRNLFLFYCKRWSHCISEINKNDIFTQWKDTIFSIVKNNMVISDNVGCLCCFPNRCWSHFVCCFFNSSTSLFLNKTIKFWYAFSQLECKEHFGYKIVLIFRNFLFLSPAFTC